MSGGLEHDKACPGLRASRMYCLLPTGDIDELFWAISASLLLQDKLASPYADLVASYWDAPIKASLGVNLPPDPPATG